MPVKIARSAPRPSFGLPELLVAIHTSRQSCCKAGKARIFTPVRESSGESRFSLPGDKTLRISCGETRNGKATDFRWREPAGLHRRRR
jgi:hypothetical protein